MKQQRFWIFIFSLLALGLGNAIGQQRRTVVMHPLQPFSQYNGDTLAYLTLNFDGGADYFYDELPLSQFLQDLDPEIPIRTFYPRYLKQYNLEDISSFVCFPYTKEELKRLIQEGKTIYGIDLTPQYSVNPHRTPELFDYFKGLGFHRILPWTPEIEQKIGHLSFNKGYVQEVSYDVKQFLENDPE